MCTGLEPLLFAAATDAAGTALTAEGAAVTASGIQTAATVTGSILGAGGAATSIYGGVQTANATKKAEKLRKNQMELNNMRETRALFRKAQNERAMAVSNAAAGGTVQASGLPGGEGQIAGNYGFGITASHENLDIGRGLFDANAAAAEGKAISTIGSGTAAIGKDLIQVGPELGRIGSTYFNGRRRGLESTDNGYQPTYEYMY